MEYVIAWRDWVEGRSTRRVFRTVYGRWRTLKKAEVFPSAEAAEMTYDTPYGCVITLELARALVNAEDLCM
jgi:hypothetical protein